MGRVFCSMIKLHDKNWEEFNKMIDDVFAGNFLVPFNGVYYSVFS